LRHGTPKGSAARAPRSPRIRSKTNRARRSLSSKDPHTVPHRTRVLVYNVKLLPPLGRILEPPLLRTRGFWQLGQVLRSDEARAHIIAEHLTADPYYDVIVLCERFAAHARQTCGQAFERRGYHVATCPPGSKLLASSGLFVASRLPIVDR